MGQLGIPVPEALKNALFLLFLFSIGYTTGPLFFRGLKTTALPQVALTVLLCVTALLTAWGVSRGFGFDPGQAGGLVAGAMTSSAALGTAGDSLAKLGADPARLAALGTSQTVAFAVTYLIGMGLVVWLLSSLAPRLLCVDLAAVQEVADSRIPALGYGVGCALGNVVLALWGGVIVLLIHG